ncbi:MAG: hypothetical protein JXR83_01525 [Deltaproteobacteria bacterium]|nr:hypothetical protein [Deltaproteobacteria bacterium]
MRAHCIARALTACALVASCRTTGGGAWQDEQVEQVEQVEQTEQEKKVRQGRRARRVRKPQPKIRTEPEAIYVDLTRSDGKEGADPVRDKLRRQLFQQFSVDALLKCAGQNAVDCPSPVTVRLRVDESGAVKSVWLKPAQPENKVWLECLEKTYKQILFDPQDKPMTIKTRFHVECVKE